MNDVPAAFIIGLFIGIIFTGVIANKAMIFKSDLVEQNHAEYNSTTGYFQLKECYDRKRTSEIQSNDGGTILPTGN